MKKKSLISILCVCLLVTASVMGTLAWLTDRETVSNTFTVGKVDITLDETKVTPDGKPVDGAERVEKNEYHLIPGQTYTKDPMVTVEPGSEASYVRMIVKINGAAQLDEIFKNHTELTLESFFGGYNANWEYENVKRDTENNIIYEFRYKDVVKEAKALEPLFTTITVPGVITGDELATIQGLKIDVEAHAIQAATMKDADDAWAKFAVQYPNK